MAKENEKTTEATQAERKSASLSEKLGVSSDKKDEAPIEEGMMRIKVYSPYQVYFDENAASITAINDTGPFDILQGHHRFLTLLLPCELVIAAKAGEERIKISRGVMYVKEDRVTVFLDV